MCCRRGKSPGEAEVEARKAQLLALLKKHDISVPSDANPKVYQYHPPFAPNWMRLNEVRLLGVGTMGIR